MRNLLLSTIITGIFLNFLVPYRAKAQASDSSFQDVFGLDPLLYNGRFYNFFPAPGTVGNQFLQGNDFISGTARIRDVTFTGLSLNYDIYHQELILKFRNNIGAVSQIVVSDAWLQSFTLGNKEFWVVNTNDSTHKIYHILGKGPDLILEYFSKSLALDTQLGSRNFRFSDPEVSRFLMKDGKIVSFHNKRSFIRNYTQRQQAVLRRYMHENRVKLRKADSESLSGLIDFCNKL